MACQGRFTSDGVLKLAILLASVLGLILGLSLSLNGVLPGPDLLAWIGIWGELFLRLLEMAALPLVVSLVISGVCNLDTSGGKRVVVVGIFFGLASMLASVLLGVLLMYVIRPVKTTVDDVAVDVGTPLTTTDALTDLLRNLCPENIIQACFSQTKTEYVVHALHGNRTAKVIGTTSGSDLPGLAVISVVVGIICRMDRGVSEPVIKFAEAVGYVSLQLIRAIIWTTPLGVLSLLLKAFLNPENQVVDYLESLGYFVLAVLLGQILLVAVIIPVLFAVLTYTNPYPLLKDFTDAVIYGVTPPSSAAAFPYIFKACEARGVPSTLYDFSVPFLNVFFKSGSGMFIAMGALFLCALDGTVMSAATYLLVIVISPLMVVSVASVPSGSIVALITMSGMLSIQSSTGIGLLLISEFILNRTRALGNILVIGFGTLTMHHWNVTRCKSQCSEYANIKTPPATEETPLQHSTGTAFPSYSTTDTK